jgi:predicted DNA-binding protein (MmcQ/YjbR family)
VAECGHPNDNMGMDIREVCLSFAGAEETFPFGPNMRVYKVDGKIFAILGADSISLKCEPTLAVELRTRYPGVTPGYHLNKQHWNTVALDGSIGERLIADMVEDSYDLIVSRLSKRRRAALGWSAEQPDDGEDADGDDQRTQR